MAAKKFKEKDRITVTNIMPFDLSFCVIVQEALARDKSDKSIMIEGNEHYRKLTFEEISEQIISGNPQFVGTDGLGKNATIVIDDFEAYKALFDVPNATERPMTLNAESIKSVLEINDRATFENALHEIIPTIGFKRALVYYLTNPSVHDYLDVDLDSLPGWKIKVIERVTGCPIYEAYDSRMDNAIEMTVEEERHLRRNGSNTHYLN